jgi:CRP/FNR family transcriptional regulator, cyclic AMP receptor protein
MLLRADTRAALIRSVPLFEHCSKRDVAQVARIAVERTIEAGAELTREGEPGDAFYAVVRGTVVVRRRGRKVAELGDGCFIGEISLLSRRPRTATVVAATELTVLEISGDDFVALLDAHPDLWLKVARTLADRVEADEASEASGS